MDGGKESVQRGRWQRAGGEGDGGVGPCKTGMELGASAEEFASFQKEEGDLPGSLAKAVIRKVV